MDLELFDLYTTDASFNLAAEQYVFDALPRDRAYFMLWQNKNAVIVGKYQNTQAEINAAYLRENDVQVVRRLSGGGAVYHDLGNLNFTFITDAPASGKVDLGLFCRPVVATLCALGVPAAINGRNDLSIDGKKFSGNAQYVRQGRVMHHGTLLFDSDLEKVGQALHVDADKIQSKGIQSVRSRVTNIRPYLDASITLPEFRRLFIEKLFAETPARTRAFSPAEIEAIESIREARYARWDWNFGQSQQFSVEKKRRFEGCGTVTALLNADRARITALAFHGDFFSTREPELLAQALVGYPLQEEALRERLARLDVGLYLNGLHAEELIQLLLY